MEAPKVDIASLEGFLFKKSHKDNSLVSLLKKDVKKRWFKVMETSGCEATELALCYFESEKDKNAKSWIYLKDVTEIREDNTTFTLASKSRSMTLNAATRAEQRLWLQGLVNICHFADCSGIISSDIVIPPRVHHKIRHDEKCVDDKEVVSSGNDLLSMDKAECKEDNEHKKSKSIHKTKLSDIQLEINGPKVSQIEKLLDKDDHRLHGYRNTGAGATSRLHGHIRKDQNPETAVNKNNTVSKSKVVTDSAPSTINNRVSAHIEHKNSQSTDDQDIEDVDLDKMSISSSKASSNKYNRSNRDKYLKNKQKKNDDNNDDEDDYSPGDSDQEGSSNTSNIVAMNAESKVDDTQIVPKIRRASDTLDEKGVCDDVRKPTLDDLLNSTDNDHSFEIDENAIDFKAESENRKVNLISNTDTSGLSKPPRPPPNVSKPPYAQKMTKAPTSVNVATNRRATPPRAAGHPGVVMDTNFVSENWDEDSDVGMDSKIDSTCVKKVSIPGQVGKDAGVRSDDNWLEDNFDDD